MALPLTHRSLPATMRPSNLPTHLFGSFSPVLPTSPHTTSAPASNHRQACAYSSALDLISACNQVQQLVSEKSKKPPSGSALTPTQKCYSLAPPMTSNQANCLYDQKNGALTPTPYHVTSGPAFSTSPASYKQSFHNDELPRT